MNRLNLIRMSIMPNMSVAGDRNPRERGMRPLNTSR